MNKKSSNSNSIGENQNLSRLSSSSSSSSGKKKTNLISSLYNNSSNTKQQQQQQQISEKDLIIKYEKGNPIRPEDVLKLNKYTESKQ